MMKDTLPNEDGRVVPTGLSSDDQAASRLAPSGFDPSRELWPKEAEALGYFNCHLASDGSVYSMETATGYRVVRGAPSYMSASLRMQQRRRDALLQMVALDEEFGLLSDSDGSPKGRGAEGGSVHDSAGLQGIARNQPVIKDHL